MSDQDRREPEFNPYQAPQSLSELPPSQAAPVQVDGYGVPAARRTAVVILLSVAMALGLLTVLHLAANPGDWAEMTAAGDDISTSVLIISLASMLQIGAVLAYFIVFLSWLYRCYKNLMFVGGAVPRFTPGWAVGCWFVPIMNLFRPAQVMADILQYSAPLDRDGLPRPRNGLLTAWWAMFLLSGFVGNVSARSDSLALGLGSEVLDLISRGVTLTLVIAVTRMQADKQQAMLGVSPAASPGGLPPAIEPGR